MTGAASGIGKARAGVFAGEGALLMLVDIDEEGLKETRDTVAAQGAQVAIARADLSQTEEVRRVVEATASAYGRIDVLANVHGITDLNDVVITDVPEELFDRTIAVNLRSSFLTCKYTIPVMKESGGGAIVSLSSVGALYGSGGAAYTASKGGVLALTKSIAFHTAHEGIRCNTICPAPSTPR